MTDERMAEYDRAVAAMNKAAGNWAKADAKLRGDAEWASISIDRTVNRW
jgi:hypothetical protein